jgi:hypothetical protein
MHILTVNAEYDLVPCDPCGLPELNFKPPLLRSTTLFTVLFFYLSCLLYIAILLFWSHKYDVVHSSMIYQEFAFRYLPTIGGTMTKVVFRSVALSLWRITPYMHMASPNANHHTWKMTLGAECFPKQLGAQHNWVLVAMDKSLNILGILTPLQSILFITNSSEIGFQTRISQLVAYALVSIYLLISCVTIAIIITLWNRPTGLKWDPVSLADQLALLYRSNVLEDINRAKDDEVDLLMSKGAYRIGYWWRGDKVWYGIGRSETDRFASEPPTNPLC